MKKTYFDRLFDWTLLLEKVPKFKLFQLMLNFRMRLSNRDHCENVCFETKKNFLELNVERQSVDESAHRLRTPNLPMPAFFQYISHF